MKPASDYATQAIESIRALRYLAARGDEVAAAGLVTASAAAAGHVEALASRPAGHPVRGIMDELAATAARWTVNIPAIEELRPGAMSAIPTGLGTALPYRVQKGATKPRNFNGGPTGEAFDPFHELDEIRKKTTESDKEALESIWHLLPSHMQEDWRNMAVLLPPLSDSPQVIAQWKNAGIRWAEDQCQGQWKAFPWSAEILVRANQKTNSRKIGIETAVKEYLGKGFKSLARLTLIPPR